MNDLSMTEIMERLMAHPMKGPDDGPPTSDETMNGNDVSDEHGIDAYEIANISGELDFQVWHLRGQIELMWQPSSSRPTDQKKY